MKIISVYLSFDLGMLEVLNFLYCLTATSVEMLSEISVSYFTDLMTLDVG